MSLSINIPLKNAQLVIGPNRTTTVVERYIFDGWTNQQQKERFHGSVAFLEAEAIAGRTIPSLKMSAIHRIHITASETEEGTVIGTVLEVNYDRAVHDTAFIEDFFRDSGISIHHAEPFQKPVISLGRFIKTIFSR